MNVLLITLLDFQTIHEPGLYQDLMRAFEDHGHNVFIISPFERRKAQKNRLIQDGRCLILKQKIGNTQKTNLIEKGISTLLLEPSIIAGIMRYLSDVKFDLILYSTPPITFCSAISYLKKRDHARTYLLLKDIFPQNAVDIGILKKTGASGLLYRFFRYKERNLYSVSDRIGCMSPANAAYVLQHNPEVSPNRVEVCPNCIEVSDKSLDPETRRTIREKYGIPLDQTVFVYGGNLGKPQGIPFIVDCLRSQMNKKDAFFLIVGNGTEYRKLEAFVNSKKPQNVKLMHWLPKEDYDTVVAACDVGMIFLDHRFTIPNFPSRLLSYMQAKLPVLACTDPNTDLGKVIVEGGFGWWCESNTVQQFGNLVDQAIRSDLLSLGARGYQYLQEHYDVEASYETIMEWFQ